MSCKKNKAPVHSDKTKVILEEDGTTGAAGGTAGGSTSSTTAVINIIGLHDTVTDQRSRVFDKEGNKILTKVSLTEMGNRERQARKGKERTAYGHFGQESTKAAVKENLANTEKAPQHTLGNVLGLSRLPTPGSPRPR